MVRMSRMTSAGLILVGLLAAAGCSRNVSLDREAPQAAEAVKAAFPAATITGASAEQKSGLTLYEVHLTQGSRELDVTASAQGQIIEVETTVSLSEVPDPAQQAIADAIKDATLLKLEKVEHRGVAEGGKIIMLDRPDAFYEAKYRRWGIMHEVQWAPDGKRR